MTGTQIEQLQRSVIEASTSDPHSIVDHATIGKEHKETPAVAGQRTQSPKLELTVMDLIHAPMVALVNRADGVSNKVFAQILLSAARHHNKRIR